METAPVAAPPAGETEPAQLRWASVLFVDLVGYSSLTEGWDAEDVREFLAGYFELARTVVERYGGSLEKFIGDAVVAVWGSQSARADDAERSVRAGLDIVDAVTRYGGVGRLAELSARAGVVTGQVASWSSDWSLVAGDRVNLAARVQSAAEPGSVFADEVTMQATRATVAYVDAGLQQLKGFAEPVPLWRATRVVAGPGGTQRVDGLEAAFVGRGRELALIRELFHATVEGRRARLVAVSGVAGIGKSRLGWELEKYIAGVAAPVFWHRGRCPSYGDGVAFWALAEMVRARFGISDHDTSEAAAAKVREYLAGLVPDVEERGFIEPRLGVLVGVGDREFSTEDLFAGWRLFLERLAATQPVVLLFEDLHWADSGLLDFLEYMLDWSADLPIFLFCLARPELSERRPRWLADQRNATILHLEPLPEAVIQELLSDLVPDMPEEVKGRIASQAGGIPLYAVETVRALIDRGLVVDTAGVLRVVGDIEDLDVPAALTSVIAARLDGLPPLERDLVKDLSVLGDAFDRHAVSAVNDAPKEQLDPLLQALVRKEILSVRSEPLAPQRSQYAFLQGMLRSVAYDSLSRRGRKVRHQAVAAYLRSAFPDDGREVVEVIAAHLADAHTAAGSDPEAVELRVDAAKAYERAAKRAGRLGSPDTAEKYYRTAADLSADEADRTQYTADAAWMAAGAGRPQDALALLEAARDAHLRVGREVEAARLAANAGWILLNLGQQQAALEWMRPALAVLEHEQDEEAVHLYAPLAGALSETGDQAAAARHLERALEMATALGDSDALMAGLHTKAGLLAAQHRQVEAEALLMAVVAVAHEEDDPEFEARARWSLGWLRVQSDRPAAAEQLEQALVLWRRLGVRDAQAESLNDLAVCHFFAGRWADAETYAREAMDVHVSIAPSGCLPLLLVLTARGELEEAEQHLQTLAETALSDDPDGRAAFGIARGLVALAQGHFDAALNAAGDTARESVLTHGLLSHRARLAWPLAMEAALGCGRIDQAQSLLGLVAGAPRGHVPPYLQAQLMRNQGLLADAQGHDVDVESDLRGATTAFQALGYPYWRGRTQMDLGRWLAGRGRDGEAAPLLTDAAETFSKLGARPDLDRVRKRLEAT